LQEVLHDPEQRLEVGSVLLDMVELVYVGEVYCQQDAEEFGRSKDKTA
jgi:hypothetical protein